MPTYIQMFFRNFVLIYINPVEWGKEEKEMTEV